MAKQKQSPQNDDIRFDVFTVREYETNKGEDRKDWMRVGAAFPHQDGDGFTVTLHAVPVDGKLVIRKHTDKEPGKEPGPGK
jgi:hypothetical protein